MKVPQDKRPFDHRCREGKQMQLLLELTLLKQEIAHSAEESMKRIDAIINFVRGKKNADRSKKDQAKRR